MMMRYRGGTRRREGYEVRLVRLVVFYGAHSLSLGILSHIHVRRIIDI